MGGRSLTWWLDSVATWENGFRGVLAARSECELVPELTSYGRLLQLKVCIGIEKRCHRCDFARIQVKTP